MVNQLTVLFLVVKKNWKLKRALLCILLIKIDQGEVEIGTCISGLLKAVLEICHVNNLYSYVFSSGCIKKNIARKLPNGKVARVRRSAQILRYPLPTAFSDALHLSLLSMEISCIKNSSPQFRDKLNIMVCNTVLRFQLLFEFSSLVSFNIR